MARVTITRLPRFFAALALATMLLAVMLPRDGLQTAGAASGGAPEMRLSVQKSGGFIGCELLDPTYCYVDPLLGSFTLSVDAVAIPNNGYVLAEAWIDYGDVLGNQSAGGAVKNDAAVWPDCNPPTYLTTNSDQGGNSNLDSFSAGCFTGLVPPVPVSLYEGSLFTLTLTCPDSYGTYAVDLIPYGQAPANTNGTAYTDADLNNVIPKVNPITIECASHSLWEGDGDGDGCFDRWEFLDDETAGGLRDYHNPWDYYDVAMAGGVPGKDETIDLTNDILGVILHYSPQGDPPYDANYDRGPADGSAGPYPWNMTAPDGAIDLTNDILGVILQYGHNCDDPFT